MSNASREHIKRKASLRSQCSRGPRSRSHTESNCGHVDICRAERRVAGNRVRKGKEHDGDQIWENCQEARQDKQGEEMRYVHAGHQLSLINQQPAAGNPDHENLGTQRSSCCLRDSCVLSPCPWSSLCQQRSYELLGSMDMAAGTIIAWTLLGTAGTSAGTTSVRKPAPGIQTAVLKHIVMLTS